MTVPVHVTVKTIVVGDQLILSLVVQLTLEIHVLENWKVGLVSRQGEGCNIDQTLLAIIVEDLQNISFKIREKIFEFCLSFNDDCENLCLRAISMTKEIESREDVVEIVSKKNLNYAFEFAVCLCGETNTIYRNHGWVSELFTQFVGKLFTFPDQSCRGCGSLTIVRSAVTHN